MKKIDEMTWQTTFVRLFFVAAFAVMGFVSFGGYNGISKTLGDGELSDTTLTVSAPVYYGSSFPAHCTQRGWYAGVTITWPAKDKKAWKDNNKASVSTTLNLHDVNAYYPAKSDASTDDQSPNGSGLSFTIEYTFLQGTFVRSCTWYVWLTPEDAYALNGADYTATLSVGSESFVITIPASTYNDRMVDSSGVRWFPAVALGANDKVYGQLDVAVANEANTRMIVDLNSSADATLASGNTLDLNGKTLTVSGGTLTFKEGSKVVAGNASQIVASGGTVVAELYSTFSFEPSSFWYASNMKAEDQGDGTWKVVYDHICDWTIAASGNTLTATCGGTGTCKYGKTIALALNAADATYSGSPVAATFTDDAAATLKEASGDAITCSAIAYTGTTLAGAAYASASAPTEAGSYTASVTVTDSKHNNAQTVSKSFTIAPAAFDLSLSISSVNYDGVAKTVTATAKFGQTTLTEGTDYTISGDDRTQTGSPASDQTYTVIATGKGNFTGTKSATWTIKAPSGSFAADAASGGAGCMANGNIVTLTDSLALNPTYDSEKGTWKASMTITWPAPVNVKYSGSTAGHAEYIDAAHAFVQIGDVVYSGSQILDAGMSTPNLAAQTDSSTYTQGLWHDVTYTYFKSVTYMLEFSVADIEAAKAAGKIEKSITVWSVIWKGSGDEGENQYSNTGLRATTYTLTIPIDDKLILQDTEGRQIYPPHQHSWAYAVSADGKTLTATCQAQGCPQESLTFGFTGATNKVYDANAFEAELTDSTEFVKHTGATIGEISYTDGFEGAFVGTYQASVVVTVGGKDYTLVETYTIDPRPLTSLTLSTTSFDYDATEKSVTVAEVKSDTFKTGDYDIVEGSVLAEKGSGTENKTYTVTVQGKNNFTGTASATWKIVAPSGAIGATTAHAGCAVSASDAQKIVVTASTALNYDAGKKMWSAGLYVAVPYSNIGGIGDPTCTLLGDFFVTTSSNAVEATVDHEYHDGTFLDYDYVKGVDAKAWFSVADVLAAKAAGLDAMEYTVTIFARKGQYNASGLREVTYTISISLEGLVLNDEQGVQQYPEHEHDWSVAPSGEPVNTLTATCSADGCPQSPLTLALAAVSRDYNGAAFAATLTGADAFRTHVGATVSDIVYWADEKELVSAPKYTGSYEAHVVATVLGETYTLKAPFAITKPADGYSDGYEVKSSGVRYDTWAEAVAAAAEDDTILAHTYKGEHDMVTYDFSSDKELTVDLCGQTLKQTDEDSTLQIVNNGTGAVTLTNGEFNQPTHQSWFAYDRGFDVIGGANGGKVVFGAGLKLTSRAGTGDGDQVPTVTVKNVALEIAGGQYQVRGISAGEGGSISITGGQFWSNFNPSAHVAQGYTVQEIEGDYKYEVVKVTTVAASVTKGEGLASLTFNDVAIDGTQEVAVDPGATVAFAIEADDELTIPLYKLNGAAVAANGTVTVTEATNLVFTAVEAGGSGASDAEIAAAVEAETGVDVVGRTGGKAADVALWLKKSVTDLTEVKDCEYLKASFELGVDLITDGTTVDITDFEMSEGMSFTITLDKDAAPEVVKAAAEKLASRIHAADALGTDFEAVDVKRLTVDTERGTVTVAPKDGATSEFLKVLIEKDNN